MTTIDGTHRQLDDGRHQVRFERRLEHPIERVWSAITDPDEIEAWLAHAELELREGGRIHLVWLNTDEEGKRYEGADATGHVSRLHPPNLVEYDTDRHGTLTWELRPDGDATQLTFTSTLRMPDEHVSMNVAGWHVHLDFLGEWLDDGVRVDWPNWPRERWNAIHEGYEASMRPIS
jgi:uncharacterized protein YndB with AHSA1/START domain